MKKISYFVLIFIFIFFSDIVFADVFNSSSSVKDIVSQIPEMNSIQCKFKQEKYLKNIEKPITSYGNFEFKKNIGVFFDTTYPVQSKTSYTNENNRQINDIVNAVSSKKYSGIEREFDFYYEEKNGKWTLGLKPKNNSNPSKVLKSIIISGNTLIEKIEIFQQNGNKTVLWFIK